MANIPSEIIAAAQNSEKNWQIPASITLAQWALESGWGAHMPPGSNNPFGIKALPGEPSVTVTTIEYDQYGRPYSVHAAFRVFATLDDAFEAHAQLLESAPAYARARACLPDVNAFAMALTGVYATDPNYGKTLIAIMTGSNLYQYDGSSSGPAPLAAGAAKTQAAPQPAV